MLWLCCQFLHSQGCCMSWVSAGEFDKVAQVAPIATDTIALVAATVAISAIVVQRNVARKRAAIDFFLKTEMDEKLIDAYNAFNEALEQVNDQTNMDEFEETVRYQKIRKYLNIKELFAVG